MQLAAWVIGGLVLVAIIWGWWELRNAPLLDDEGRVIKDPDDLYESVNGDPTAAPFHRHKDFRS